MATISLCMIVKDEEAVLARCLDSVRGVAEQTVIVDTGSADRTREIAAAYGEVFCFPWCDDFSAARNFSFVQATQEYILWLDADDVVEPADRERLLALKAQLDGTADVVMLPYHTAFDEQGAPCFTYYRERLIRRGAGLRWQGAVHECIPPQGWIVYGDAAVTHRKAKPSDSRRNLRIYEGMLARGQQLDARGCFYYARELQTDGQYARAAQAFEEFLTRADGWVENRIQACRDLAACLTALGQRAAAKETLTRSFAYDRPRAETCCALAALELEDGLPEQAAFWYRIALDAPCAPQNGAFVHAPCYGYVPCLGLCVCCDRMGQYAQAAAWNERAALYQPSSAAVAYNRRYFAERRAAVSEAAAGA